eukprot:c22921_g1_i1 orf=623-1342(+)
MISILLTGVVLMEGGIALLLMTHLAVIRRPLMKGLDVLKIGRGAAAVKTAGVIMLVVLAAIINSMYKIKRRIVKLGLSTPTDQYMLCTHLLQASLLGYALFQGLVINRLHHYLREIISLRMNIEALTKQAKATEAEYTLLQNEHGCQEKGEANDAVSEEVKSFMDVITDLRQKVEELQLNLQEKGKAAKAAEANAIALQKQSEGFLLEYDRLLGDNEHLRSQLASLDRKLSRSDSKKKV